MSESARYLQESTWAIVELMGRNVLIGQVIQPLGLPSTVFRLDVPAHGDVAAATLIVGFSSVYKLTLCDEQTALHALNHVESRPVNLWTVPNRVLPAHTDEEEEDVFTEAEAEDEEENLSFEDKGKDEGDATWDLPF